MVHDETFDIIVVGGGPAGASAAAFAARASLSVLLLEKDQFPRFHIGESLIPGVLPYLDEIGVGDSVRAAGFVEKYAAEFVTTDGAFHRRYVFGDSLTPEAGLAYQVERAAFDELLITHARNSGARVQQAERVHAVEQAPESVSVVLKDVDGATRTVRGRLLIDASGQQSLVSAKLGLRTMDRELRNIAVFGHFSGVSRAQGPAGGDITIVLDPEGWWWVIPLKDGITSLGFVAPRAAFGARPDAAWLERRLTQTPVLAERCRTLCQVNEVRVASDYSYRSSKLVGDRWLLAGDAAAFLDPVFSTGVFLGVCSAVRAARAAVVALSDWSSSQQTLKEYEAWLGNKLALYGELVKGFYQPEFVELLMHPTDNMQLRQAVTSALAGYADHTEVSWRLRAFLNAVRANKDLVLCPRLPNRREAFQRLSVLANETGE